MISQRTSILALLSLTLAACGGGGGGGSAPPATSPPPASSPPPGSPATPSSEDLARAQNAKLRMTLDAPTQLYVTWLDTFDNEQGYQVERRVDGGSWTILETLLPIDGGYGIWERNIANGSGTYRVSAVFRDFSLPLHAAPGESEVSIDVASPPVQLLTAPAPTGGLRASVLNAAPAQSVTYFAGGAEVANVTTGDDFATAVPWQRLVRNGTVAAHVHKSTGLTIQTYTPTTPNHNEPALVLRVLPADTSNALSLTATAYSPPSIVSVQFFANGQLLRRVDQPNRVGNWVHEVDPASLPSNVNTFRALATDGAGATVAMDVEHTIETTPALTVEGVFDGMITTGDRLDVRGTFGENMPGTVLSIDVGYRNSVFRTRTSPFNFEYAFAGQSGGRDVTIRAVSPTGQVSARSYTVIRPSTTRAYELIATDAERLLAADRGTLMYQKRSGAIVTRNAAGVETPFEVPAGSNFSHWYLTNDRVVAQDRVNHRVHAFTGPGQTLDLMPGLSGAFGSQVQPVVRGDWVAFTPGTGFAVHNLTTGITNRIDLPSATLYLSYDFDTTPGNERLLFPAIINGAPGVYGHSLVTNTTELLAGGQYQAVRTDGARLALGTWAQLFAAPLNNPSATTPLGNRGSSLVLKDGWVCFNTATSLLSVNDGSTTTQLAEIGYCDEHAIADGRLLFSDPYRGVHSWSPSTGKQLILNWAVPAMHTQGVAYLLTGQVGTLYRTTLP